MLPWLQRRRVATVNVSLDLLALSRRDSRIKEMGRRIIDDALWNLIEPLLPPAKSPSVQVSASQARAESRSADGHSVRAEDLHSLARSSCQNGMWLVRESLAAAAGLARGCSPGCISRVAVDQTTANPCRSSLPSRPGLRTANQYSPLWSKHVPIIATLHATFDPIMDANPATQFPCSNASPSEGRILTALPDTWKSAPVASPWDGIQVHNYQIREEGEVRDLRFESNLLLCLYRKPHERVESLNRFGRWQHADASDSSVAYGPPNAALNYRWGVNLEQSHLIINIDWLQGTSGRMPIPLHGWFAGIHDRILVQLIDEIVRDASSGTPTGVEHAEWLALSALYRFTALARNTTWECNMGLADAIMDRALQFIHSGLDSTLRVREIASAAGFDSNLYAFMRLFGKYTGLPPHQYVMEARLERAKNMLLRGHGSVTDVALACGFNNMSHFSTAFKRRWAASPSQLIKESR